jgi:TPP-dependent pyruvate/acetoin dehydrogenase alpha subunit
MMQVQEKRTADYNVDRSAIVCFDNKTLLRVYENICKSRFFEYGLKNAYDNDKNISPIYLSLGQEAVAAALAEVFSKNYIYFQHRAHDMYLCVGGNPAELRDELRCLPTGYRGGRTGSNCLSYMKNGIRMVGHNGFIGTQVPQAVGTALVTGEKTLCIVGDGAVEEDYVLESIGFAESKKVPVLFICMDNNLSVLTTTDIRRSWQITDVVRGFGMEAYDLSDCPWTILKIIQKWDAKKPLFLNCRVCRELWHTGTGNDGPREWERNVLVRQQLLECGLEQEVYEVEQRIKTEMELLWKN